MPRKPRAFDSDHACHLYEEGYGVRSISRIVRASEPVVIRTLKERGVELRGQSGSSALSRLRKHTNNAGEVVRLYTEGISEVALANKFGIQRSTIRALITRAGLTPRTSSEANLLRWKRLDSDGRDALLRSAHSEASYKKAAQTRLKWHSAVGDGEAAMHGMLVRRGYDFIQQLAINSYNLDLFEVPIAVEIHGGAGYPFDKPSIARRLEYLLERKLWVIYVMIRTHPLSEGAADEVISFLHFARRNPSARGKYRVIRGDGEDFRIIVQRPHLDHLTRIVATIDGLQDATD